jgi:hypothetical protein
MLMMLHFARDVDVLQWRTGIIATLGDLERLAEHRDRVVVVVLGNERKDQSWLHEKMPSASDKISLTTS